MKKTAQFTVGFVFGLLFCFLLFLVYTYLNPIYPNA